MPEPFTEELQYPAACHMSVITDGREGMETSLRAALVSYTVTSAPTAGKASGKYAAWRVSVTVGSRDELHALDGALRALPGVRMIL